MRPTGRLHLGHYLGVLTNWIDLQNEYDCYFTVVDWHALTTKADDTSSLRENTLQLAIDWLAAGIDPSKATLFIQSSVPQVAELHLLLSMLTPNKWVETDPTLKDMVAMSRERQASEGEALTYGLLGYPVLQTADILSVGGELVPVGKDQLAHLEISRDIARRFNHRVGHEVFAEPSPLLTDVPLLKGLDGRKMGKSYNNGIFLADSADETVKKMKKAVTDPKRIKKDDPGTPADCQAVFPLYQAMADKTTQETVANECTAGSRGCMNCKLQLAELVNERLSSLRERRITFENDKAQVETVLKQGAEQARTAADEMLQQVKTSWQLNTL